MLVLTQRTDDKIYIGGDITVTILRVKGRVVKVGIEAPSHVRVLRSALVASRLVEEGAGEPRELQAGPGQP